MMHALLAVVCSMLAACSPIFSESDCSDVLIHAFTSVNGQFVANLVRRDCGATAAYVNIVYLKNSTDSKGKDGDWGEKVYVLRGELPAAIEWKNAELRIKAPTSGQDVFLKRDGWIGVKIVYE